MTENVFNHWGAAGTDDPLEPLFLAAPIMMYAVDASGIIRKVSHFLAETLGFDPSEMIGKNIGDFLTAPAQEHRKRTALPELIRSGKVHNQPYDFRRRDGVVVPVLLSATAQFSEDGQFEQALAVLLDHSEEKSAQAASQQKQRMDAIDGLVGGVAHGFNNILAVIQGNLEFLEMDPNSPDRDEFVRQAKTAAKRGSALTRQLLSFVQRSNLSPVLVNVNDILLKVGRTAQADGPENVVFETATSGGLWLARVDPTLLETALQHVLSNALGALSGGGNITLEAKNVLLSAEALAKDGEDIAAGDYVMLAVTDTGAGMDAETIARAFEPFFSTKDVGEGVGLGLSMVFGFIRQSQGTIRVQSMPGEGTTVRLYLPAAKMEQPIKSDPILPAPIDIRGKTVLLAEDEDAVRDVFVRLLELQGLEVVACENGDAAYAKVKLGLRPDVLITDIAMPGFLQGPGLVKAVRDIIPDLRALFVSGYPNEAALHRRGQLQEDRYLVKPVGNAQLLRALYVLLDDSEA